MASLATPPYRLGHYRLLHCLGYGGMAEIYLVWDEREQREVALKVVDRTQEDRTLRFQREVEVLRLLKHEYILPIFDAGEQDGWIYFAMPYLPLGSLRDRLRHGPLALQEAGSIFAQIASALYYAHERGILHRDIKPSNILFRDERSIYLADFGLTKLLEQEGSITQTGCLIGTPHYLAPELVTEDASQSSDQYALGVLLYKMLTGTVPFRGATAITICWKHIHEQPLPPSSLNPAIPPAIDRIILQALAKDPGSRFCSVQQMAQAYQQALREAQAAKVAAGWNRYFSWKLPRMRIQKEVSWPSIRRSALNGIYHAVTVGAMIIVFCVAPLYLGFSLERANMEPVQSPASVLGASTLLEAQPFLSWNDPQGAGGTQSVSLPFSPHLSSAPSSPSGSNMAGLTQNAGQKGGGKGHGQSQAKGYGKHHTHRRAGKQPGHRQHKKKDRDM